MKHTNRLAQESSPYLLQHAHNPVDWYPWGEEALKRARSENKPLLVSIGYAACHWCHVMEKESFEDEETAEIMNKFFVNVKIDREERPDLDHIYMDAVQAMTGSGGWPLNVFLTPEGKPFYGGTYFPPQALANHPAWKDILYGVASAYLKTPKDVEAQADNLTQHLLQSNTFGYSKENDGKLNHEALTIIFENIMKTADQQEGGFGKAPMFPQTLTIQYLLAYYHHTKNAEALKQACVSLDKMIYGGIYDQVGGGFSRYSTDRKWLVPHFEKMLYDNALLVSVISEAYQVTHNKLYEATIRDTLRFVERELLSPEGGFYSALDADSEGEEGKYYVWSRREVDELLGERSALFCRFYNISQEGNWEGKNILHVTQHLDDFAQHEGVSADELSKIFAEGRATLLAAREKRVRPQLDDKMLLGWNALMNIAYTKAYAALGDEAYKLLAVKNMEFILDKYADVASGGLKHTYKNNESKFPAFLDDYAYVIQALIHLQEITADVKYLQKALDLSVFVEKYFSDEEGLMFYFTHENQDDIVIRKKEIYDGATPSGNAIMAWNLLYLAVIYDNSSWRKKVEEMLKSLFDAITKYPTSFGAWAGVLQRHIEGVNEIVIIGSDRKIHLEILHIFNPGKILQASTHENPLFPLLKGKTAAQDKSIIYLCKNYACHSPVDNIPDLIRLLENKTH